MPRGAMAQNQLQEIPRKLTAVARFFMGGS
jgi:hypothetical protein